MVLYSEEIQPMQIGYFYFRRGL